MRHWMAWLGLAVIALAALPAVVAGADAATGKAGDNAALVNGKAISRKEVQVNLDRMLNNLTKMGRTPDETQLVELRERALRGVINEELLFQESRKVGVKVSRDNVQKQVDVFRSQFPGEKEYLDALRDMGTTEATLRAQIEKGLAIQGLVEKRITGDITVSDAETRAFYDANPNLFGKPETVRASHILIKVEDPTNEAQKIAARKKVADIQGKLNAGEDFAELATVYSEDPGRTQGGDLGYFQRGQMVPPFEEAAFSLQPGQVSQMVFTPFGYHLIQVTDRKPAAVIGYDETQEKIRGKLKQDKVNAEVNAYIEVLRGKADIRIL